MMTSPGSTMGTVAYMSPEQVRAEEVDARTDLFAFGAVLYEMATGELAFSGNSSGVIFEAILNRNPPEASSLNPKLPAKLEEVISKSLDRDRELRYQTAAELRGDLKRIKRTLDTSRAHASVSSASASSVQVSLPTLVKESTVPRKPVLLAASVAAAAALLVGLLAGVFLFKRPAPASLPTYHPLAFRRGSDQVTRHSYERRRRLRQRHGLQDDSRRHGHRPPRVCRRDGRQESQRGSHSDG